MIHKTELGHLLYKDDIYERYISNVVRQKEDLNWEDWGIRFDGYLKHLDELFSPDLVIIGRGVSKKFSKHAEYCKVEYKVVPASLQNEAAESGPSMYAYGQHLQWRVL